MQPLLIDFSNDSFEFFSTFSNGANLNYEVSGADFEFADGAPTAGQITDVSILLSYPAAGIFDYEWATFDYNPNDQIDLADFIGSGFEVLPALQNHYLFYISHINSYAPEGSGVSGKFHFVADDGPTQGTQGDDTFVVVDVSDTFKAGAGNDLMDGTGSSVRLTLNGQNGDDRLLGGSASDRLWGGNGNDQINGGVGHDGIKAGAGNDMVVAGWGRDHVNGGQGNDILYGDGGKDLIYGHDGADVIIGGTASDRLAGGAGADLFVFSFNDGEHGRDVIQDFDLSQDHILMGQGYNGGSIADDPYAYFMDHAEQVGDAVVFDNNDQKVVLRHVDINDLTADHFVHAHDLSDVGGYRGWAENFEFL